MMQRGVIRQVSPDTDVDAATMLVAYLQALCGGVHVVTVDGAAAGMAVQRLGPACELLGLTAGLVEPGQSKDERRRAYRADLTFGSFTELGYDYLRDNRAVVLSEVVQNELRYAIIQRADKILWHNGRLPLLLSAPVRKELGGTRRRWRPRGSGSTTSTT